MTSRAVPLHPAGPFGQIDAPDAAARLFAGPGEMRALCRAVDWAATPLGPVAAWPLSLRTTVATVLASRHPMFLWWGPGLIQIYNDAYRPSLGEGGRHPRALGMRGAEFWTEIWEIIKPDISRILAGGEATWHEDHLVPIERNGRIEQVWWTYSYGPAFDDDGSVGGVLVICQETTARVIAEKRLQTLADTLTVDRARLDSVLRAVPAVMAVYSGPEHVLTYVNPTWERVIGKQGALGRTVREVFPEMVSSGIFTQLDRVYETGDAWVGTEIPLPIRRAPGGPVAESYWSLAWIPLPGAFPVGPSGHGGDILLHALDVTEQVTARREVERLFRESEHARRDAEAARERTAGLQSLTAELAASSTVDGIAEAIVTHATALLGAVGVVVARLSVDGEQLELLGASHMPEAVRDAWRTFPVSAKVPLADVARTGEPVFLESRDAWIARYPEFGPLLEATGHHANAVTPLIVDERILGVLGMAFDVPRSFDLADRATAMNVARQCAQALERARLFAAERVAREAAEAASRAKGEFLAVMSHELRTPLNAIDGYAELMELGVRGPVTDEQRVDLARIRKSQKHLLGLINGVLNYSRVEAGAVRYSVEDIPVDEALATCEALVAPQLRAKRLAYEYRECDATLAVRADGEKLQQIVLNLLTNAVKFTEPGGRVVLECRESGADVRINVSDTGRGIARDQFARVFEPFVQVDAQLTRTQEGVGLGLAISRDLARGMGGDITVESTLRAGSTFTLTLPRVM